MPRKKAQPQETPEQTPDVTDVTDVTDSERKGGPEAETFPGPEGETFPTPDEQDRAWNRANGYPQDTLPEDRDPEDRVRAEEQAEAEEVHYAEPMGSTPEDPDFEIVEEEENTPVKEPTAEEALQIARSNTNWWALQKLVADQIYTATKEDKKDVLEALMKVYDLTKAKTFEVVIPTVHGTEEKVAQATLTGGKDGGVEVEDEEKFGEWLEDNRPELVEVIEHPAEPPRPARPAWKETLPARGALKQVTKILKVVDGRVMDTTTGEFVPGLRYAPPKAPDDFRLTWGGQGTPGKRRAMDMLLNEEVAGVTVSSLVPLPEIEQ